ncbi:MAG: formylglycine-generating enzyme family protein [Planctomycetota bacterium]|nr:formylglycine-generating enzyme family protein [Planctomycetota bacterium]
MYRTLVPALFFACALVCGADAQPHNAFPLWDSHETVEQYANRVNLPSTKTLDLGGGVHIDLVLIPAGKFVMGTPEPKPVDEEGFRKKIVVGRSAFAAGVGVLLVLIATVIIRAIRKRHRPQYSLARFMAMTLVAGVGVMGGMHWWFSTKALTEARAEYKAAFARYQSSYDWEKPAHEVTLTTPFYMGKYPVTQEQYMQVMGTNPSHFKGQNLPVETVSWDNAAEFCKKVSEKTGLMVRLPTDAEREYACRAGTTTTYNTGDSDADLDKAAWYYANSKSTTHPVGQKAANAWGLHDMHGNVWEWCLDLWQEHYGPEAAVDPKGPENGQARVLRGGSWGDDAGNCRSAYRDRFLPVNRYCYFGFRVVVAPRTP